MPPGDKRARFRKFVSGPGVVIVAIVGGLAVVGVVLDLFIVPLGRLLGYTEKDFARQGETVKVAGGNLTALSWCAFGECPTGENVQVRVKACATSDRWVVDERDFEIFSDVDLAHAASTLLPRGLGRRMLDVGRCAVGTVSFNLSGTPESLGYEGHGHRVSWGLRVRMTKAVLARVPADERRWLVQLGKFHRRAISVLVGPSAITGQTLRSLASLGEDCDRVLDAPVPVRFARARKILAKACPRLRTASRHFKRAVAVSPDARPGTADEPEFNKALDAGFNAAENAPPATAVTDILERAYDNALARVSTLRSGEQQGAAAGGRTDSSGSRSKVPHRRPQLSRGTSKTVEETGRRPQGRRIRPLALEVIDDEGQRLSCFS